MICAHVLAMSPHSPIRVCSQGVANRDVKLENTLLVSSARPLIKLCDFGYSKVGALPLFSFDRCTAHVPQASL